MSVQVCKNGNVKANSIQETNGMMLNTFTTISYTPTADNNSCMGSNITGFEKDKEYYIELDVVWSGFKTDPASNFNIYAQGSCYDGSSWTWNNYNPMAGSLGNFKSLVLSADSGTKHYKQKFTADLTGYSLGCRSNYSNEKGNIAYKNIRVIPVDGYVDGDATSGKILKDSIVMDNFIEN